MDRIVRLKDGPSAICSPADAVRSRSRLRRAPYYVNVIDAVSGYPGAIASATETLVDLPRREGESPSLGRSLRQRTHGILAPAGMHAVASTSGAPTRRAAGFRRSVPNWDSPRPDHCWRPQADRGDGPVHGVPCTRVAATSTRRLHRREAREARSRQLQNGSLRCKRRHVTGNGPGPAAPDSVEVDLRSWLKPCLSARRWRAAASIFVLV
jgi:hypothetical protein